MTDEQRSPDRAEQADQPARKRRLIVSLDASAACLDALDDLVMLAAGLNAEMRGLVVEDTDLLDLAGYRVVMTYPSETDSASLEPELIDRIIRRHVERVRHEVERAAARRHVHVEIEVRRGRTALEVIRSASEDDLIVIARQARGFTTSREPAGRQAGPTAREVIRDARRPVFLLGRPGSLAGPVYTVFDGSASSRMALDLAATLSTRSGQRPLIVLIPAADDARAHELIEDARKTAVTHHRPVIIERLRTASTDALCGAVSRRPGVLVVAGSPRTLQEAIAEHLLECSGCSLLLVPEPDEGSPS